MPEWMESAARGARAEPRQRCAGGSPIALSPAMRKAGKDASAKTAEPGAGTPAPAVVLVAPQLGENIGAAARAMANFGLSDLRLVAPRDGWPSETARAAAAGADAVLDNARVFDSAEAAIADLHYVCATTARVRDAVKPVLTPEAAVAEMTDRGGAGQACGVLFGQEKAGLTNDHVALCDVIVTAPVNPQFASLNLAQAVLLMGYEWIRQQPDRSLGRRTDHDGPAREGLQMQHTRPATREELTGFFEHLERELDESGFLWPPEKRPVMVRNLRNIFQRIGATEQEIRTLRGVVSALTRREKTRRDMP